jgi:succinate dehydrogenase / fumarate reductase cytochrome b subunit
MTIENKKGWISWFNPFKYGLDRWMYALHRLTGIVLGIYLILHIFETANILRGPVTWNSIMVSLDWPFGVHIGPIILSLVFLAAVYHGLNGLRLTIVENGLLLPRPYRPEYPYKAKSIRGPTPLPPSPLGGAKIDQTVLRGWLPLLIVRHRNAHWAAECEGSDTTILTPSA